MQTEFEIRVENGVEVYYAPDVRPTDIKPYTLDFTDTDGFDSESISTCTLTVTNCSASVQTIGVKTVKIKANAFTASTTAIVDAQVSTMPSNYRYNVLFKLKVAAS